MRWTSLVLILFLAGCSGAPPRNLSASSNALSPEGWRGKRYYENGRVIAEEFDAVGEDGRVDLWRYYKDGSLLTEDRDRDSDGRIDYTAHYFPKSGVLEAFTRDTDFDGQNDIWLRYLGDDRWSLNWDRNRDGDVDFVFVFRCPPAAFGDMHFDPVDVTDMREVVPAAQWVEVDVDENFDRRFDSWTRYKEGRPSESGIDANGDGYPERWSKIDAGAPTKAAQGSRGSQQDPADRRARITGVEEAVEIPGKTALPDEEGNAIAKEAEDSRAKRRRPAAQAAARQLPAEKSDPAARSSRTPAEVSEANAVPATLPPEE